MRALIFDLDGTLVDTVYPHVVALQQTLAEAGVEVPAWLVHRRIGMSASNGRPENRPVVSRSWQR